MSLSLLQVSNVELLRVSIQNTTGFGLIVINAYNSTIYDSSFAVNNFQSAFECLIKGERYRMSWREHDFWIYILLAKSLLWK